MKISSGGKLEDEWRGPFVIQKIFPNGHVQLTTEKGTTLKTKYKLKHLKPYRR